MDMKIFTGNIGCGKSLLAKKFAKMGDVVVNMDIIQSMVGGSEYGLYNKDKKAVYWRTEEAAVKAALDTGLSVVIDRTNMDRKRRQRFIEIGKRYGAEIVSYDWGPGTEDGLKRRIKDPNGVPSETWKSVWEYMRGSYEPPSAIEGFDKLIEAPQKFKFYAFDFDGTIVENAFPEIGRIVPSVVEKINQLWEDLSNIIIIWTVRSGDFENQARKFLLDRKILFDFINENPIFDTGGQKIFAHIYYDDRNGII